MATLIDTRRYLTDFDATRTGHILTDVLVIGSGVAGARAAIEAADFGLVTMVTKERFGDSATAMAQGGVAAALSPDDSSDLHVEDTIRVGCGVNNRRAVTMLIDEGPARINDLLDWGMRADRTDGELCLTREAGHSLHRVVHAQGDQTGREISRVLRQRVHEHENIRIFEDCFVIDLITQDGICHGAVTYHTQHGHQLIWAKQTIIAAGGCGQLWRETTNPNVSTGDGLAIAFRAGAALRNMEYMQFHPTTLYVAGAGRALISEAVRGEGGHLVDRDGDRFMTAFHPDGEMAPRDIVSRAIQTHLRQTRANCAFLDVRHIRGFRDRFPLIAKLCADFEIDVERDLIPVRPSAHYMIGGVVTDIDGTTNVDGLLCCGEAASTGVHGANRLASNSLLEGLVFGQRAGRAAGDRCRHSNATVAPHGVSNRSPASSRTALDLADIRNSLRSLMWRNVGIVRNGDRLRETCEILDFWAHFTLDKTFDHSAGWMVQNMLTVARAIAASALARKESLGVHFRSDEAVDGGSPYDLVITRSETGSETRHTPLASE